MEILYSLSPKSGVIYCTYPAVLLSLTVAGTALRGLRAQTTTNPNAGRKVGTVGFLHEGRFISFEMFYFILWQWCVLMVWLGLGTETTWLGLGKYHVLTYVSLTRLEILPMFHQKYPLLLPLMHSSAPRMVPLPKPGSRSSDFGVFVRVMLECGSNMDAKKKLFHTLLLKVFKHNIDCRF